MSAGPPAPPCRPRPDRGYRARSFLQPSVRCNRYHSMRCFSSARSLSSARRKSRRSAAGSLPRPPGSARTTPASTRSAIWPNCSRCPARPSTALSGGRRPPHNPVETPPLISEAHTEPAHPSSVGNHLFPDRRQRAKRRGFPWPTTPPFLICLLMLQKCAFRYYYSCSYSNG